MAGTEPRRAPERRHEHAIGAKVPVRTKPKLKTAAQDHMTMIGKSPTGARLFKYLRVSMPHRLERPNNNFASDYAAGKWEPDQGANLPCGGEVNCVFGRETGMSCPIRLHSPLRLRLVALLSILSLATALSIWLMSGL